EVHVVGHEERSRANDRGAGGGMDRVGAEVGDAVGIRADLFAGPLELAAADVGEVDAVRTGCGLFVQEDRDAKLAANPRAEGAGEGDAVLHGGALEGDEGADVGGPDARVLALVGSEVNEVAGARNATERR